MSTSPVPCPWCGVPAPLVWVHGHAQCAACGVNSEPCCQGAETCPVTFDQAQGARADDPGE